MLNNAQTEDLLVMTGRKEVPGKLPAVSQSIVPAAMLSPAASANVVFPPSLYGGVSLLVDLGVGTLNPPSSLGTLSFGLGR